MRLSIVATVATTTLALPAHVERAAEGNPLSIISDLPVVGDLLPSKRAEDSTNPLSAVTDITSDLPIVGDLLPSKRADPFSDLITKVFNQTENAKREDLPGMDIVSKVLEETVGSLPTKRQDEIGSLIEDIVDQVKDATGAAPSKRAASDPLAPVTDLVGSLLGGASGSSAKRAESDALKPVEDLIGSLLGGASGAGSPTPSKRALDPSTLQQLAGQVENALNLSDEQKNAINGALSQFTTSLSKRAEISIEDLAKEAVSFLMNGDQSAPAPSKRDCEDIVGSVVSKVESAISGSAGSA